MKNKDTKGRFTAFTDSLVGKQYGLLTVAEAGKSKYGGRLWLCKCDCGKEVLVQTAQLNNGRKKDCGCVNKKRFVENIIPLAHKANQKYKVNSASRLYSCWSGMMSRCSNEEDRYFKDYGGRGISVCKEWESFDNFADWALSNGYADNLTIDRIDVNGNYCPENCHWATWKEQANNTRRNRYFEFNGEKKTLSQLADKYNINYRLLHERVVTEGWDLFRALTTPKMTPQQACACSNVKRDIHTGRFLKAEAI